MDNIQLLSDAFFCFIGTFCLWGAVHISISLKTKKIIDKLTHQRDVSDAGLSSLMDDIDNKIAHLSQDLENYHDVNRECLRLLVSELRQKEYQQDGWKPSRTKEHMVELAIEEAKTKKRRPGRPPRTSLKSE